jgi:hypothetical protein
MMMNFSGMFPCLGPVEVAEIYRQASMAADGGQYTGSA